MEGTLSDVSQVFDRFKAAFTRNDLSTCTTLLSQLKVTLTGFPSLPPLYCESPTAIHELTLASNHSDNKVLFTVLTTSHIRLCSRIFNVGRYQDINGIISYPEIMFGVLFQ